MNESKLKSAADYLPAMQSEIEYILRTQNRSMRDEELMKVWEKTVRKAQADALDAAAHTADTYPVPPWNGLLTGEPIGDAIRALKPAETT